MDFYEELQKRVEAEASDKDEYLELAKIAPTEKAKKLSWDVKPFEAKDQPCQWCKTAENAEKRFLRGVKDTNETGIYKFTVTEYHIEKAEA